MFGKFSEQMKKSTQPAASLFEMNAKSLGLMSQQNTMLLSGFMDDSVKLLSTLSEQSELNGFMAAQSVYAESIKNRLTSASKTTYAELSKLHAQMTELASKPIDAPLNPSNAETQAVVEVVPAKAPVETKQTKKVPRKQAAVKKATATPNKPSTVAKDKPIAKKVASKMADKKATPTAPVKKASSKSISTLSAKAPTTGESLVAEGMSAEKPTTTTLVTETNAPKTVAKLSPADVKVVGKK